jgi:hypothetical protein
MQELIKQLTEKAGLSAEQATKSLDVIKSFVKEKFPMLGGAVDQMMGTEPEKVTTTATAAVTETNNISPVTNVSEETEKKEDSSILDKISDVIPGQVGEKIEDFAKGIGGKISGLFGK